MLSTWSTVALHEYLYSCVRTECVNGCAESYELCCLVETFPHHHESLEDYIRTLQSALLYAKTVTLGATHWPQTNAVMLRNRRIGTSMSGVAQFVAARGMGALHDWCNAGYAALRKHDKSLSERFAVRESVKLTSIKPSGTVSLRKPPMGLCLSRSHLCTQWRARLQVCTFLRAGSTSDECVCPRARS